MPTKGDAGESQALCADTIASFGLLRENVTVTRKKWEAAASAFSLAVQEWTEDRDVRDLHDNILAIISKNEEGRAKARPITGADVDSDTSSESVFGAQNADSIAKAVTDEIAQLSSDVDSASRLVEALKLSTPLVQSMAQFDTERHAAMVVDLDRLRVFSNEWAEKKATIDEKCVMELYCVNQYKSRLVAWDDCWNRLKTLRGGPGDAELRGDPGDSDFTRCD